MKQLVGILFLLTVNSTFAVAQMRFHTEVFSSIDSATDVSYGEAMNIYGKQEKLLLDVFQPKGDTMRCRPLVIFIHGGGFKNNSKTGSFSSMLFNSLVRRGFVCASIDYRLGIEDPKTNKDYAEALYRAQQDGRAAVRFFHRYASKYGIDTAQVFIAGTSAGAMTCLAIAYMDSSEVPEDIDVKKWGSLEGNSGNPGYSSAVQGVMNCWGALIDYRWINKGDAPLFNAAGTADKTVPFDSSFSYHGFKYGSSILYQRCLSLGIPTAWHPFPGAGHTLDNNKSKQDSCIKMMAAWLSTRLHTGYATNNGIDSSPGKSGTGNRKAGKGHHLFFRKHHAV